jgi:hypothetical protein
MANHSDERNYPKHIALVPLLFLSVGAMVLVSDTASAQRTNTIPDAPTAAPASPTNDKTSALGQALAACNQEADQGPFTLPGLKGEVTLDRCYKGHAHLICVFTALSTEAKSLTDSHSKIVDANYPETHYS